jgi:4-hydroxy-2-oxoheptanedioate aldolase
MTQSFRAALAAGAPQIGLCVQYPAPGIVERIGGDWDWVWIDGQHGELAYPDVLGMVRVCDLVGRPALVRVAGHEPGPIGLALDTLPAGVIVPCVDTPEQARSIVNAAKFPPLGGRSYGARRAIDRQGRAFSDTANDDSLLVVQIESPQAIENVDAIAALPGVDALFLGPDDIMLRRGYSMTTPRSRETLGNDMEAVAAACRRHGKIGAMVAVSEEMLRLCLEMGFTLLCGGAEVGFLANGSKQAATQARGIVASHSAEAGLRGHAVAAAR